MRMKFGVIQRKKSVYELEKKAAGEWLFVLIKHQNLLTFFVPYMLLSIVFNVLLAVVGTLGLKICSYK